MQSVDVSGLDELDLRFADALREIPQMRRQMHEEAGTAIRGLVRIEVGRSGINDRNGKIKSWQEKFIGSGGGYAAVRAVAGGERGRNPGAITNYLESGHKARSPSGNAKRPRKSRAQKGYARAFLFYERSRGQAQAAAVEAANRYADGVAERLGD